MNGDRSRSMLDSAETSRAAPGPSYTDRAHGHLQVDSVLQNNCRPGWPDWTCTVANVCGLTSTALWFIVLLPQVWKNFRRKSVLGLSVLWATANFTASLTNLFFVFLHAHIPLYGRINSVYMPVLEFTLLLQFWIYGDHYGRKWKVTVFQILYTVFCVVLWSTIIALQLGLSRFEEMQWLAITLWCVETFPQVILNIKLRSTIGQSTKSVAIGIIGKTTDFISNYGLVIPMQYVIMTYFSSSVAFVNGIQVVWYYQDNRISKLRRKSANRVAESSPSHPVLTDVRDYNEYEPRHHDAIVSVGYGELLHQYKQCRFIRRIIIVVFFLILIIFAAGLVWNTQTFYALFAPVGIASVVFVSYLYYKTRTPVVKYSPINDSE